MNQIIELNKDSIYKLCQENSVEKLYAFGSVLNDDFSDKSDIDFIVKFSDNVPLLMYADNYFALLFSFEKLFRRDIDLITQKSLRNPYFIAEINATKQLVYAT